MPTAPRVLLVHSRGAVDQQAVDRWLTAEAERSGDGSTPRVARSGEQAAELAAPDDASIFPVRVAWLPPGVDGNRRWRRRDLITIARHRGLSQRTRESILRTAPDRARVIVGEPARLSELTRRMSESSRASDERWSRGKFIEEQARLALDRVERGLTGSRYKVPHDVKSQLIGGAEFNAGVAELARSLNRSETAVRADALADLEEMTCVQSPLMREVWARWAKFLYSRAYELDYDQEAIARLRALGEKHPLVFLPTHKSNLDGYVIASLLHETGFPPNHTLGGINMAFWPLGPVGRRVGVIWIRRDIKDDAIYRWVLRHYLAYLVRRRFNLEWYIEGGRTRTGKLLPPKLGLLHYLIEAVRVSEVDDVHLVPISIVYDRLDEVAEMTAESRGAHKQKESLFWLIDYARRQTAPSGRIQVRFGEPLAMSPILNAHEAVSGPRLALAKLAFDVCTRINRATPVTRTGLLTLALLGLDGRSLSAEEVRTVLAPLLAYVEARGLPGIEDVRALHTVAGVTTTLSTLVEYGVVSCYAAGPEPVYAIGRENELVAAFYRNGVIHWFVTRAITELALLSVADGAHADAEEALMEEARRLRDLLKFEFFFSEQAEFGGEVAGELSLLTSEWPEIDAETLTLAANALAGSGAVVAHRVLNSFIEAIYVVAEALVRHPTGTAVKQEPFLAQCVPLGEQFRRQQRILSGEAVSRELFATALKLAGNRGLLEPGARADREAFVVEMRVLVRRVHRLAGLDASYRRHQPALNPEFVA